MMLKRLAAWILRKTICSECHKIIFEGGTYGGEHDTCWPPMTVKYPPTGRKF